MKRKMLRRHLAVITFPFIQAPNIVEHLHGRRRGHDPRIMLQTSPTCTALTRQPRGTVVKATTSPSASSSLTLSPVLPHSQPIMFT